MFEELERICERPAPFEFYTTRDLWTEEHTSAQMLSYHLNESVDAASRNSEFINRSVAWIVSRFGIGEGSTVADFGCGPGLYTTRLAKRGAKVTGIDFSERSIEYAKGVAARENSARFDWIATMGTPVRPIASSSLAMLSACCRATFRRIHDSLEKARLRKRSATAFSQSGRR